MHHPSAKPKVLPNGWHGRDGKSPDVVDEIVEDPAIALDSASSNFVLSSSDDEFDEGQVCDERCVVQASLNCRGWCHHFKDGGGHDVHECGGCLRRWEDAGGLKHLEW